MREGVACPACGEPEPHVHGEHDPVWDATDAACACWWRGNDQGVASVVRILHEILDGEKRVGMFANAELQRLSERISR
jgi:hypothetical protein